VKPIKSGKLRQRFLLQAPTVPETFDSYGQPVPSFDDVGTFWGEIIPLGGYEAVKARQIYAEATHQINMRWQGLALPVDSTYRVLRTENGVTRTFGIGSINDVEFRHRQYSILAKEVKDL